MAKLAIFIEGESLFDDFKLAFDKLGIRVIKLERFSNGRSMRISINKNQVEIILINASTSISYFEFLNDYISNFKPDRCLVAHEGVSALLGESGIGDCVIVDEVLGIDLALERLSSKRVVSTYNSVVPEHGQGIFGTIDPELSIEWIQSKLKGYALRKMPNIIHGKVVSANKVLQNADQYSSIRKYVENAAALTYGSIGLIQAFVEFNKKSISPIGVEMIVVVSNNDGFTIDSNFDNTDHIALLLYYLSLFKVKRKFVPSAGPTLGDVFVRTRDGELMNREMDVLRPSLDAGIVARSLRKLVEQSTGEFYFAILGSWGRGKSYLMRLLKESTKEEFDFVSVSAWKYRYQPEFWIYLHEVLTSYYSGTPLRWWLHLIRKNLILLGWRPIIMFLVTLIGLFITPLDLFKYLLEVVGIALAIKLIVLVFYNKSPFRQLIQYIRGSSYGQKLGLRNEMFKEFDSLFQAAYGRTLTGKKHISGILATTALVIFLIFEFIQLPEVELSVSRVLFFSYKNDVLKIIVLLSVILLIVLWIVLVVAILKSPRRNRQLIIVVDDLDRLDKSDMIGVIEAMKLFIEEPQFKQQIKIFALFEEKAFIEAASDRFMGLNNAESDLQVNSKGLYLELMQKYFVSHIRLPRLLQPQIGEYIDTKFSDRLFVARNASKPEDVLAENKEKLSGGNNGSAQNAGSQNNSPSITRERRSSSVDDDFELASIIEEIKIFKHVLDKFYKDKRPNKIEITPRMIDSFIITFNLCKLILEELGVQNVNGSELARMLALEWAGNAQSTIIPKKYISYANIVDLVC